MTNDVYERFQRIQCALCDLVDDVEPIDTVRGNELFQRLSDVAFNVMLSSENKASEG